MKLTIEQANPAEAEALTAVAVAAKGYWGYPQEWIELWREELVITAKQIRAGDTYVGRTGQEIVFVYAISPVCGTTFELEACWMAPAYIGQGYGRMLFAHLLQTVKARGGTRLEIVSDPHALGFYQKMGAVLVGEVPSTPEGRMLPLLAMAIG